MVTLSKITFTAIFILFLSLFNASTANTPQPSPHPFRKIYAFGDSYTDTGNTRSGTGPSTFMYVSNPPYGRTFFHKPTNRYSDGRLVIDFVAQQLSLPYLPPYKNQAADRSHGVNFAVAGSTAIKHSFFVRNNLTLDITPESLGTQLIWFNEFLKNQGCRGSTTPQECAEAFNDALIWVGEIGANDYAYTIGSSVSDTTIQVLAIKSLTGFLQALLDNGAKYLVVQGLPTTGCLPLALYLSPDNDRDDMGCVKSVNYQSYTHNIILQIKLKELRMQYPHAVIVYADYWNAYRKIIKNSKEYGFTELYKACCGSGGDPYNFDPFNACGSLLATSCPNPSQYINWDGVHLTESMYKVLADSFLNGSDCRPPFKYLINRKQQSGRNVKVL